MRFSDPKHLLLACTLLLGALGACDLSIDPPQAAHLVVVSGDQQTGPAGSTLPQPLVVRAEDPWQQPVKNAEVTFTAPGGSFQPATVRTDAQGLASVTWTLPTTPGTVGGEASIPRTNPITAGFSATVQPGPAASVTL
ncbi:MAG TPA: Ig-like domain-containing protein, partial [Longimicrobium sp.]|nr:Ig-like domain-containing protein [Longimicrobium sp.]